MYQSTIETVLKVGDEEINGLLDFPDMLGESDKIEVTTMKDKQRKYIPGLQDPGDMEFTFLYEGMGTGTNWAKLKTVKNTETPYSLVFPDGSGFSWKGTNSLSMPGKGVGEALEFKCKITPSTDIEEISAGGVNTQSTETTTETETETE